MSKKDAKDFFDKLEADNNLKATVKQKIEEIATNAGFPGATEQDLTDELAARWAASPSYRIPYSEPPGF